MANQKLTDLAAVATPLQDTDLVYIVRGTTSHKTTFGELKTAIAEFATYPEVANFAALPSAASNSGATYVAIAAQGVYFVNRKPAGLYRSDGASWGYLSDATEAYFQDTLAWTNITSKPATFTPSSHTHTASEVTDFNATARAQIEAAIIAGSNITITPAGSGATRTLTIASTGGGGGGGSSPASDLYLILTTT